MRRRDRSGMTLIELLVVIAISAVLAGLLLPAILQARGAGRKAQCESNLKQLAQAVQTFHHRMDCLPAYWGPMKGGGGQKFGGWLLHLLPDLDQQALYDMVPASTTTGSIRGVVSTTFISYTPPRWLPAIPESTDPKFEPGEWKEVSIGKGYVNGSEQEIFEWQLVGRVGSPGVAAREDKITQNNYGWIQSVSAGVAAQYVTIAQTTTIPCLTDAEDPGLLRSPMTSSGSQTLNNVQLTNYMANAHVFTKFDGARLTTGSNAGKFPAPRYWTVGSSPVITGSWNHSLSGSTGPIGRSFGHIADGLTNTILFAEGMRQCDNLAQYRAAFFPSGNPMNEHGFGIECRWRDDSGNAAPVTPAFGHTLMFQTRPKMHEVNPLRAQALHGDYLMIAMCDGSTRAISSLVDRREPIGAAASGRENFGTRLYSPTSRGAFASPKDHSPVGDGIWDMLMVPNDPPGNVLSNDGTIGREK